ncbi:MAG: NUDIX domain-containing protein [Chloroflexota bacterium]
MSLAGQRLDPTRYSVIPRTLTFLTRGMKVLLMRIPSGRGAWAGRYNGIGGHVEPGEDPLSSARREVHEETGLQPDTLRLCGVILVDTGTPPGIALYVFHGVSSDGEPSPGAEGTAEWVAVDQLSSIPMVEDVPTLLPRVLAGGKGDPPFCAVYRYDPAGRLSIHFAQ